MGWSVRVGGWEGFQKTGTSSVASTQGRPSQSAMQLKQQRPFAVSFQPQMFKADFSHCQSPHTRCTTPRKGKRCRSSARRARSESPGLELSEKGTPSGLFAGHSPASNTRSCQAIQAQIGLSVCAPLHPHWQHIRFENEANHLRLRSLPVVHDHSSKPTESLV